MKFKLSIVSKNLEKRSLLFSRVLVEYLMVLRMRESIPTPKFEIFSRFASLVAKQPLLTGHIPQVRRRGYTPIVEVEQFGLKLIAF